MKSICSVIVLFIEFYEIGILKDLEKRASNRLNEKSKSISLSIYFSMFGCLTFTATFFPLYFALYTCPTEPDAIGFSSNSSKIYEIYFPFIFLKYYFVSSKECSGALYRRCTNFYAIYTPIISLLWLIY